MTEISPLVLGVRQRFSKTYITGRGIEIGALDAPYPLMNDVDVTYVDRFAKVDLLNQYPELRPRSDMIGEPDVVDDGETLNTFADSTQDFVIASHFLEHCANPLGTLRAHCRILRPGGYLLLAVPNTGNPESFDHDRERTSFAHLVRDDEDGPEWSRRHHFWEWVTFAGKLSGDARDYEIASLMERNFSIHFHCWTAETFKDFLEQAIPYNRLEARLVDFAAEPYETVAVLQRNPTA